jgi:MoxR-like ATPase
VVRRQLASHPLSALEQVLSPEDVVACQRAVRDVHVDDTVLDYVVALVQATREAPEIALGASPRATVSLTRAAQAKAVAEGRDYVLPDDVKALAPAALGHRLVTRQSRGGGAVARDVVRRLLDEVPVPLRAVGRG